MEVEDLVLLYPPRPATSERLRLDVRRLGASGRYRANPPDPEGWIRLPSVGLRIKAAEDGERLLIEDVRTGERLRTSVEEEAARRAAEERAEQEAEARRQEAQARRAAEERAEQEAAARRQAEQRAEQAEQRAEQGLRRSVEDLCGLLGIEWTADRGTAVAGMDLTQLEALWADLRSQKRWP
jgi:hypothetical protein